MPIIIDRPAVTTATGPFRRDPRTLRNVPPLRSVPGKVRLVKDLLRVGKWPVGLDPVSGNVEFWDVTNRQDWALCERTQLGVSSRGFRQGPYQPTEDCVHTFDQWYAEKLAALL